jgi:very long chain acyl-CoA dehydrogenase
VNACSLILTFFCGADEQFLLKRLADAAIDVYGMAVVLSRASRSIEIAVPTADYEVSMTKVFCQEAHQRAKTNLESIKDSKCLEIDGKLKTLSEDICSNGGVVQSHPLGF